MATLEEFLKLDSSSQLPHAKKSKAAAHDSNSKSSCHCLTVRGQAVLIVRRNAKTLILRRPLRGFASDQSSHHRSEFVIFSNWEKSWRDSRKSTS